MAAIPPLFTKRCWADSGQKKASLALLTQILKVAALHALPLHYGFHFSVACGLCGELR